MQKITRLVAVSGMSRSGRSVQREHPYSILGIRAIVTPNKEKRTHDIEFKAAPPKIMALLQQRTIMFPASSDYDSHYARQSR
jgi:hypothetical protein